MEISSGVLEKQLVALAQVCNLSLPSFSTVEDLYICENPGFQPNWNSPIESEKWLELLKPFVSVKNLYLSDDLGRRIAPALKLLIGDRITEVLPALENIFLEGLQPSSPYKERIRQFISLTHRPNFYSRYPESWGPFWLDHGQDFPARPLTPQSDRQNFPLDLPQPSGSESFQEDVYQFISPQQPDPQNLHLDRSQPSGPFHEDSEQHSSAQSPTMQSICSLESQPSGPFQEGGWLDPQNFHLDFSQTLRPHEDTETYSSVQSPTMQSLYSVESLPSRPSSFQEDSWPNSQNLHFDWLQPSGPFHEDSEQYPSVQSHAMQSLHSEESQPLRPFQEGGLPDPQNFHSDWSRPSGPFHEDSEQHSTQSPIQNLYLEAPQPSRPFQEGGWLDPQNFHLDWSLPSELSHEDSEQYCLVQSPTMQSLYSEESRSSRPFQEGGWPDLQNFYVDQSQTSGLSQWEECIVEFAAERQKIHHPITLSFWDRKYERVGRDWTLTS